MIRLCLSLCLLFLLTPLANAADFKLEQHSGGIRVLLDGELFTEYLTNSGPKPYLWPIIGPGGKAMTRAYPMKEVAGEKRDHHHHRSMWFTHGDVNGVDFWLEGKEGGTIVHREFAAITAEPVAEFTARNDWLAPDGRKVCEDQRRVAFSADGDHRIIDFDLTLTASEGPVTLGDTKEGTFGIRVPTSMDVDQEGGAPGGRIVNSEGLTDAAAWGKPARWVDYSGPVEGETLGIAILNHPQSFRFPTHWHVRTYGLFAANPFGLHDFYGDAAKNGAHQLAQGEAITLRYRVIFHRGDASEAKITEAFEAYAQSP
jgi:hypothetical protein